MITDFVRDGKAWFKCLECGAEQTILQYTISPHYDFPVIDYSKTNEMIASFTVHHALCKAVDEQIHIDFEK